MEDAAKHNFIVSSIFLSFFQFDYTHWLCKKERKISQKNNSNNVEFDWRNKTDYRRYHHLDSINFPNCDSFKSKTLFQSQF